MFLQLVRSCTDHQRVAQYFFQSWVGWKDLRGESNGTVLAVYRDVKDAERAVGALNNDDLAVVHVKTRLLVLQLQLLLNEEDAEATISRLYCTLTPKGKKKTIS